MDPLICACFCCAPLCRTRITKEAGSVSLRMKQVEELWVGVASLGARVHGSAARPRRFSWGHSVTRETRWWAGPRLCAAALAHAGTGVGEAVSVDGRCFPWLLPCAAVCSEWCWFPPSPTVADQLLSAANPRAGSLVFLNWKEGKCLPLKCSTASLLVAFLFYFETLRCNGDSRSLFF